MQIRSKVWKYLGFGLIGLVLAGVAIRSWVVPRLILGQIEARLGSTATIRSWWLNGRSAGVVGLTLHEGRSASGAVWASADRVESDLSLGGLLRGRTAPARLTLAHPALTLRLDRAGKFLNLPQVPHGGGGALPQITAVDGVVTFRQDGRPEMVVRGVYGGVRDEAGGLAVSADSRDPEWGELTGSGTIAHDFARGHVRLVGPAIAATPAKVASLPFAPPEVWANVTPTGPMGVTLDLDWGGPQTPPVRTRIALDLLATRADSPTLKITSDRSRGRILVVNDIVQFDRLTGGTLGGDLTAHGTLDFSKTPPQVSVDLGLKGINVADTPKSWQLDEAGITGRLTGTVQLRATLDPKGADLSGSSGDAVVEHGTIQGIPFKTLKLAMRAQGDDLQYDTKPATEADARALARGLLASVPRVRAARSRGPHLALMAWAVEELVALQAPPAPAPEEPKKGGIKLPKSITTHIELDDVDMAQILGRAQWLLGTPFPVPISGKLALKADATIPLGQLRSVQDYAFHGDLTLTGASIDKVDFGRLAARIDLEQGRLKLSNLRGRLVDHPDGGPDNPPGALPPSVEATGPLPPGGFRANVEAGLSPPGPLSVHFEGNLLPLGELAAPALPRPTPLSGLATLSFDATGDLGRIRDADAWTVTGKAESLQIAYKGARLDRVALRFDLKDGTLDVPDFAANLLARPLAARLNVGLKPPRSFKAGLNVSGWDLGAVLAAIPTAPKPAPLSGTVSAQAEATGTLTPLSIATEGRGLFGALRAGTGATALPIGDVPFRWTTEGDTIVLSGIDARPFGGKLRASARIPTTTGRPTSGEARFSGIDTARLSAALPGQAPQMTGKADGDVTISIPADASAVEATVHLSAPDLTVQGVPAEKVHVSLRAHRGSLAYEVTAESLGGRVKFQGAFPLTQIGAPKPAPGQPVDGELRAVGFTLAEVWRAVGMTGALSRLSGEGALDANVRSVRQGPDAGAYAHGVVEFRNLIWGRGFPLGTLKGILVKSPSSWRVEPLSGELLGGVLTGFLSGSTPATGARQIGFGLRLDRATLGKLLAFVPALARQADGLATLRAAGTLAETLRATAELDVPAARFAGMPVHALHAPAEVELTPGSGSGQVHVRSASARFAGGTIRGDASFHLGANRAFRIETRLADLDLGLFARLGSDTSRPASGKISGRISLNGPDPADSRHYRGRVVLDLTDASVVALPVFRELDRFLGAARGGLFEDGDVLATIANRQVVVEAATLEGRLVQLHAAGTVGFDGQLNLEVLVNTNQIIPQTGAALLEAIPGLRQVVGRSQEAALRFANFLSNRLMKLRVTGTLKNPSVNLDPGIPVADTAVGFFSGVLKLPLGLVK